jgi:hypothetical protein
MENQGWNSEFSKIPENFIMVRVAEKMAGRAGVLCLSSRIFRWPAVRACCFRSFLPEALYFILLFLHHWQTANPARSIFWTYYERKYPWSSLSSNHFHENLFFIPRSTSFIFAVRSSILNIVLLSRWIARNLHENHLSDGHSHIAENEISAHA